jgi:hypothetical protein
MRARAPGLLDWAFLRLCWESEGTKRTASWPEENASTAERFDSNVYEHCRAF